MTTPDLAAAARALLDAIDGTADSHHYVALARISAAAEPLRTALAASPAPGEDRRPTICIGRETLERLAAGEVVSIEAAHLIHADNFHEYVAAERRAGREEAAAWHENQAAILLDEASQPRYSACEEELRDAACDHQGFARAIRALDPAR